MGNDAIIERHIEYMRLRGRSDDTRYYRARILARLAAWMAPVDLVDADKDLLTEWIKGLTASQDTIAQYIGQLRVFYKWAEGEDLLPSRDPARRLPVPACAHRLPRPPADPDVMAALAAAPERIRPWLALAGWQGLRAKEIALLRRDAVMDRHEPPVLLVVSDATKGRRERAIPLSPVVLAELRAHGMPAKGYLFRRADHATGPNRPGRVSHVANEHLAEWGYTLHQLRHWYATRLLAETHDLRLVQHMLGHVSPATTSVYTAYDLASATAAMSAFPEIPGRRIPGSSSRSPGLPAAAGAVAQVPPHVPVDLGRDVADVLAVAPDLGQDAAGPVAQPPQEPGDGAERAQH